LGGQNWKIEGKWAENDKNQSIFEGQGGHGPPTSGVPALFMQFWFYQNAPTVLWISVKR